MTRWGQFTALLIGQLSGRKSIRDIIDNLKAHRNKLYHSGVGNVSRSSLARVNENQPAELYESVFYKLLSKCRTVSPKHKFNFKNPLHSMDSSVIDLSLSVFPWADFRSTNGAIKRHSGFDHDGHLPAFMTITEGKCHDIKGVPDIKLPKGSILAMDRGYNDYNWFESLNSRGVYFVTRLKKNSQYHVIESRDYDKRSAVTSDQEIKLTSQKGKSSTGRLRRIGFKCSDTGKHYFFLTNNIEIVSQDYRRDL